MIVNHVSESRGQRKVGDRCQSRRQIPFYGETQGTSYIMIASFEILLCAAGQQVRFLT